MRKDNGFYKVILRLVFIGIFTFGISGYAAAKDEDTYQSVDLSFFQNPGANAKNIPELNAILVKNNAYPAPKITFTPPDNSTDDETSNDASPVQTEADLIPKKSLLIKPGDPNFPLPKYPEPARRKNLEGTVRLKAYIAGTGTPQEVLVETSSGSDALDQAALDAVKTWNISYEQAQTISKPQWVSIPIKFGAPKK